MKLFRFTSEGDSVESGVSIFRRRKVKAKGGVWGPVKNFYFAVGIGIGRRLLFLFDWELLRCWMCIDWRRDHSMYRPADMDGPGMICRRCGEYNANAGNTCSGSYWKGGLMFKRLKKAKSWLVNRKDWKEYREYERSMYS